MPLSELVEQLRPMLHQPPEAIEGGPPLPPHTCYYGSAGRVDVERGAAHTTPFHPRRWGGSLPAEAYGPFFGSDTWACLDPAQWQHSHGLTALEALSGDRRRSNDSAFLESLAWWAPHPTAARRAQARLRLLAFAASCRQPGPRAPSTKFVRMVWQGWYQAMGVLLAHHGMGWHAIEQRHLPVLRLGETAGLVLDGQGQLAHDNFIALGRSHDEAIERWDAVIQRIVEERQHQAMTVGARSYCLPGRRDDAFLHWCSRLTSVAYATRGSNRQTELDWPSAWTLRAERAEIDAHAVAVPLRDFVPQRLRSQRQRPDDLLAMLLAFAATRCLAEIPAHDRRNQRRKAFEGHAMKPGPAVPSFEESWRRVRAQLAALQLRPGTDIGDAAPARTRFAPPEPVILQALPLEPSDALLGADDALLELEVDLGDFRAWADGAAARQWFEGGRSWPVFIEVLAGDGSPLGVWLGAATDAEDLPKGRHRLLVDWGDADTGSPVAALLDGRLSALAVRARAWLIDQALPDGTLHPAVYVWLRLPA